MFGKRTCLCPKRNSSYLLMYLNPYVVIDGMHLFVIGVVLQD